MKSDIVRCWEFADIRHEYESRDAILYALGIGLGGHPLDANELRFVTESRLEHPLPTFATVLARPPLDELFEAGEIDRVKVVQGEQRCVFDRPLPLAGEVVGRARVTGVWDKGAERGALIRWDHELFDAHSGERYCLSRSITFARGDGGCGGDTKPPPAPHAMPSGPAEAFYDHATVPQAALIYRQLGDHNPLHSDPEVALKAGFGRPILHGLCTYGIAGWAVIRTFLNSRVENLVELNCRFSKPAFPGETLRTEMWRHANVIAFRVRALERDVITIDNGRALIQN
ncbi:MaoC/PaaZ C-terminal domain-containing protein [Mesorhizobium sp.]|uniref:MaoC/PaaZ C-terminal domain-containing protein n=1 Tax=Mesorhizobium sp. TaxID=1871066 RepID=UPI000FE37B8C|nr:MaoC/PaaZ C-terminal domain-containing protein [Mesorhizobium sp.]RWN94623.1 MAG: 3-alpha,7-alpha,12-alpha-trihydroxy-5-beta-cholest-24-enoyl-CoA hydratase [Mesorhizobium sp.]RWO75376.1 MAG: 3-alpha,7-alpha,12-alpha-trihydroxy-5-beta-cholest-24-enoyl-CoA hydratase [Mesorhizobium sp.]TJU74345.1 MAG: 3-alpha,7-alpha,12-alpha-trihydroxy-5-beta-cholest-24-enoyl-CoA hydratase [Mesorhizobium sp.]